MHLLSMSNYQIYHLHKVEVQFRGILSLSENFSILECCQPAVVHHTKNIFNLTIIKLRYSLLHNQTSEFKNGVSSNFLTSGVNAIHSYQSFWIPTLTAGKLSCSSLLCCRSLDSPHPPRKTAPFCSPLLYSIPNLLPRFWLTPSLGTRVDLKPPT